VFVNQAGVLYTLGDMGKVINNLPGGNVIGNLAATAKNAVQATVGGVINNAINSGVKSVADTVFSDRNVAAVKDFFRNDGIDTYALANDLQSVASSNVFQQLGNVNFADAFKGLGELGNLSNVLDVSNDIKLLQEFEALGFDVDWGSLGSLQSASGFADPAVFGGGLPDLFKNVDNIFGPALGAFGNNFISGINLGNLSADGLIQGLGTAAINTGISIVTDQFRNIIAGEITSMTNITSLISGGTELLGSVASSVGDFFNFGGGFSPDIGGIADIGFGGFSSPF